MIKEPIVKTKAGKFKCISDIMKPPKFLTLQEFNNLIDNCSHLKDKVPANRIDTSMNNFLERFSGNSLSLEDLINVFSINSLNDSVLPGILGKMFANLINEVAQQKYSKLNLDCLVLPDKKGIISKSYSSINDNKEIQKEFIIGLNENIYKGAMDYFDNTYHTNVGLLIKTSSVQIHVYPIFKIVLFKKIRKTNVFFNYIMLTQSVLFNFKYFKIFKLIMGRQ